MPTHTYKRLELYGGAMETLVPIEMVDVSDFRDVPDFQEMHTDAASGATLIVELLSHDAALPDGACGRSYYDGIARANESVATTVDFEAPLSLADDAPLLAAAPADPRGVACAYGCLVAGTQRVSKFRNESGSENEVFVGLCVLRFHSPIATDVLVSLSAVAAVAPGSSEARVVTRLYTPEERLEVLRAAVRSLRVNDWGLFVPE